MSKRVVFNPIFQHLQGKFYLKDEDGCGMPVTFKEMNASGHRVLQIGESRKRDLEQKPYSQEELIHQGKFKIANAQTNLVMKDEAQKAAFAAEYKAALKAGTTTVNTLRGFVFAKFYEEAKFTPTPTPTPGGNTTNPGRQYTIRVTSANTEQGTVSGGGTYSEGSRVTLTATPKSGFAFDKWSDGVTTASRSIQVSQNLSLTASFKVATGGGDDEENYN